MGSRIGSWRLISRSNPAILLSSWNAPAQLPTNTTSVAISVSNNVDQLSLYEPTLFDLNSTSGCAEALNNGFLVTTNLEGKSSNSGIVMDASAQLSTMSVPVPVLNHFEQPSLHEPSLFDPQSAPECAEALKHVFAGINQEGESNVAQSSTSASVPIAQPEFYTPPLYDIEKVDEWGPFFSGFS